MVRFLAAAVLFLFANGVLSRAPLHLNHPDSRIPNQYIVVLKDEYKELLDAVIERIQSNFEVDLLGRYSAVFPGFTVAMPKQALQRVLDMNEVKYVKENQIGGIIEVGSWGLDRIDARTGLDNVFNPKYSGSGVHVYVVDTGVRITHNDFGGRASYGWDAVDKDMESDDCHGHGTHCAGTASGTVYGVAKLSNPVGLRAVNCLGFGPESWVIECMDWVLENAEFPAVSSFSLAYERSQAIDDAVERMHNGGVTVIAGAANDNDDASLKSPAGAAKTYTIAGTDIDDSRAWFSNFGTCVDIFAPGVDIVSAHHLSDDAIATMSGTSMSTPHAAGAAALILEENTVLTPDEVHAKLTADSTKGVITDVPADTVNYMLYVEPKP
ncbi:alkaline serine exoprotease A-like [Ptychodera flava]|uniref:alkaline serine exoprotease A-like n=1 Tax=Ptychodera flava TaxID=63121 RepID=UPI00396A4CD5